jgi:hypothetical protein
MAGAVVILIMLPLSNFGVGGQESSPQSATNATRLVRHNQNKNR